MRYELKGEHKLFLQLEEAILDQFSHWNYKRAPDTMGAHRRMLRFVNGDVDVLKYNFSNLSIDGPRGSLEIMLSDSETAVLIKAIDPVLYELSDEYANSKIQVP